MMASVDVASPLSAFRTLDRFHSSKHLFRANADVHQRRTESAMKSRRVLERADYVCNPPDVQRATSGEERLRQFEEMLENGFGIERGDFQRRFHAEMTRELAENIVGIEDWARVGERLKRSRGWRIVRKLLAASAPRRFGKSVALSSGVAAYAVVVPQGTQCIFSTGRRASKNDLQIIYKVLCDADFGSWVVKFNDEELWLMPDKSNPSDVRKIFSYPSKATIRARSRYGWSGGVVSCVCAPTTNVHATTTSRRLSRLPPPLPPSSLSPPSLSACSPAHRPSPRRSQCPPHRCRRGGRAHDAVGVPTPHAAVAPDSRWHDVDRVWWPPPPCVPWRASTPCRRIRVCRSAQSTACSRRAWVSDDPGSRAR